MFKKKEVVGAGVAIITSEYPLLEKSVVSLGGHARTLTLAGVQWTNDALHSERIKTGVRENFGFLAQVIADEVIKIGIDKLLKKHSLYKDEILNKMHFKDNLSNRIASKLAPIMISAEIIKDKLKIKELDVNEILDMIVALEQESIKQRTIEDIVYDLLISMINKESKNYSKNYEPDVLKYLSNSDNCKFNQKLNNHCGHIHIGTSNSYVLLDVVEFDKLLELNGYLSQKKPILDALEKKQILIRTEKDRQVCKANKHLRVKHYKFMINEFNVSCNKTQNITFQNPATIVIDYKNDEAIETIFSEGEETNE
jgi:hypothetical protein